MKLFNKSFVLLSLLAVLFVKCDCKDDEETPSVASLVEQLARDWELASAQVNGADAGFAVETFTLTFRELNADPTSFSISQGSVPVSPSPYTNSGDWQLNSTETEIIFAPGTGGNEFTVSIVGTPSNEELTIRWIDPNDKTDPEYTFRFVAK